MTRRTLLRPATGMSLSLLSGLVLWSCSSSSPSTTDAHSPEARRIAELWWLMFALGAAIYVVVVGLVVASLRNRLPVPESEAELVAESPKARRRGTGFIIIGGLIVPGVVLTIVAVETVRVTNALAGRPSTVHIRVDGEQYWWRLEYPDDDVVSANEIHVPVGVPVELTLETDDVIHSFWVPELNGKVDMIPGRMNHLTFTPEDTGTYRGQCAEFCGIAHAHMAFLVIVQSRADYDAWLAAQRQPAVSPSGESATRGEQVFLEQACAGCHTVTGTDANGTAGPDLTHFGSHQTIAADTLPNTPHDLARWLGDTQNVKPGALMPQVELSDEQVSDLVAYLEGLK